MLFEPWRRSWRRGRRDLPPNVQPAGAEEAFKAWAYQRPTALCTPPKAVVGYMKAIYCISADALTKMQAINAHAFEVGSMHKEIDAVWSSYDRFTICDDGYQTGTFAPDDAQECT